MRARSWGERAARRVASILSNMTAAWRKATASKVRTMRSSGSTFDGARLLPRGHQGLRLAVVGPVLEALAQFGQGFGAVPVAFEAHGEIEVIIRVIGIGRRPPGGTWRCRRGPGG